MRAKNFNLLLLTTLLILSTTTIRAQKKPEFINYLNDSWVDSLMHKLTLKQKIGQLFIAQAYSRENTVSAELLSHVKNHQVGGVIFMQGVVGNQLSITNRLQNSSNVPLLICTDGEWGPAMRLKNYPSYPYQMTLGALNNDSLIYRMGREIGQQLRRMGVHVNFAPVSDVNNNPNNPVINYRSFGEDPKLVTNKAWAYAKGMQDEKVLAVAKHFPGHGDTNVDSHIGLPVIKHSEAHLDSFEIFPFQQMINAGLGGVMSAHIQIPALEPDSKIPASLSYNILQKKLRNQLGFEGVIFTDAMNMSGVQFDSGKASVMAIKAGNDMLEIVPNIDVAISAVVKAVESGEISIEQINYHCRKILALKKWLQLDKARFIVENNLNSDLNKPSYEITRRQLYQQSLTAAINRDKVLPLERLDTLNIAVISLGEGESTNFQDMANRYAKTTRFALSKKASVAEVDNLVEKLLNYNLVIIGIHGINRTPANNYGTTLAMSELVKKVSARNKTIVSFFGNPYALAKISGVEKSTAVLVTYQDNNYTQELSAQAIFGAFMINGRLPVNVNKHFKMGQGDKILELYRLKYSIPEQVNISSEFLESTIDSIAKSGIANKAYPGCQVLIAVDGNVIFSKEYGKHTYEGNSKVEWDDIYDIASITKITAGTPAIMKMIDDKIYNLDYPFSFYYPDFRGTDKEKFTTREVLAHQSRLAKWISFWSDVVKLDGGKFDNVYSSELSKNYNIEIAKDMYIEKQTIDNVYKIIKESPLRSTATYAYSDLGFIVIPRIVDVLTGEDFYSYLNTRFYKPLGASTICFNAHSYFPLSKIVPTEKDNVFRKQLIHGYVHDEAAAMLGGVSGHAGIFSNANDLAKLMQMYLQNGKYGGKQYIDSAIIAKFTTWQYAKNDNRRALGFDKPYISNKSTLKDSYPCPSASSSSFGHTGFTGTMVWMDPEKKILFVFLSNRVYPQRNNNLSRLNIRGAMLETIYKSIEMGI